MPKIAKEMQEYYKSRVRAVLVIDAQATLRGIQLALEKSQAPISLSLGYLSEIVRKIHKERYLRTERANIGYRIATIQDKIRRIDGELWAIAADKGAKDIAKVQALKALAENELKLLNAEMDAGIFDRKVGTLKVEERKVSLLTILSNAKPNEREQLLGAFKASIYGTGNQGSALPLRPAAADQPRDIPAPPEIATV